MGFELPSRLPGSGNEGETPNLASEYADSLVGELTHSHALKPWDTDVLNAFGMNTGLARNEQKVNTKTGSIQSHGLLDRVGYSLAKQVGRQAFSVDVGDVPSGEPVRASGDD